MNMPPLPRNRQAELSAAVPQIMARGRRGFNEFSRILKLELI